MLKKIDFNLKHVADPERHNELTEKLSTLDVAKLSEELGIGQPTVMDIISDLSKPGLDPRDNLQKPLFRKDIAKVCTFIRTIDINELHNRKVILNQEW